MIKWECNGLTFLLLTFIFWNTHRSNVQNFVFSVQIQLNLVLDCPLFPTTQG